MPRNKGKKKKGKIIRPGMEEVVSKKLTNALNEKLTGLGIASIAPKINLESPNTAA